jgi:hypothetical protein
MHKIFRVQSRTDPEQSYGFHPDYDISAPGPGAIASGSELSLLLMTCSREQIIALVLETVGASSNATKYRRVGIVCIKLSAKRSFRELEPLIGLKTWNSIALVRLTRIT